MESLICILLQKKKWLPGCFETIKYSLEGTVAGNNFATKYLMLPFHVGRLPPAPPISMLTGSVVVSGFKVVFAEIISQLVYSPIVNIELGAWGYCRSMMRTSSRTSVGYVSVAGVAVAKLVPPTV